MLTQEQLKEILFYCPTSGQFTWIKHNKYTNIKSRGIAGHTHPNTGYVSITIDRKFNAAHRLAWLYMTGSYPEHCIDHINGLNTTTLLITLGVLINPPIARIER